MLVYQRVMDKQIVKWIYQSISINYICLSDIIPYIYIYDGGNKTTIYIYLMFTFRGKLSGVDAKHQMGMYRNLYEKYVYNVQT